MENVNVQVYSNFIFNILMGFILKAIIPSKTKAIIFYGYLDSTVSLS
ncbi:hypothetical protein [Clostridium weizhouense]|uniref:Uncharacterized protein n=1 Tax=Clostridium weizhouense TaxID=2859781 RepID=A0ABS7ASJ0_9CLOT|nr:hypothetical protein [Clostridium weizhouense]